MLNPFANAMSQLDTATAILGNAEALKNLRQPKNILEADVTIDMDNGQQKTFKAYRIQYNNNCGPYKGGIRFHPDVTLDEVKALGFWMTIKTSTVGIPMGGGKGGVAVNPKDLSETELEKLSRSYMRAFYKNFGPKVDVPAPDVNTNAKIMDWMEDEYEKLTGDSSGAVITGKSLANSGSQGRDTATADGGFFILKEYARQQGWDPKNTTVVVQGFGNAGGTMAHILYQAGFKIIGLADSKNAIIDSTGNGFDVAKIQNIKDTHGSLAVCTGQKSDICDFDHEIMSPKKVLEVPTDILILAALENQITADNVNDIKAKTILELANGPITPDADKALEEKGVVVIPDVLANAGGVTVSYFEWQQNMKKEKWTAEQVHKKLEPIMQTAFQRVQQTAEKYNISYRTAAFISALSQDCLLPKQ